MKEKIAQIAPSLPPGVTISPFYDRSELIDRTIDTLKHALIEEIILVTLAHIIFLWHFRSILIVTLPLPVSILISFMLMKAVRHHQQHHVADRHRHRHRRAGGCGHRGDGKRHPALREGGGGKGRPAHRQRDAGRRRSPPRKQVGRPIFFAMAIIILAFVPVFALTGQEGKLFHPLAFTKTFAMIGSTLLAVTLVPVLCSLLVRGPFHAEDHNIVMGSCSGIYDPTLDWALEPSQDRRRRVALLILAVALLIAFGLPRAIGETDSATPGYPQPPTWSPASARNSCRRSTKAACFSCRC